MATYQELRSLFRNSDLMEKVETAIGVTAHDLATTGTPSADDLAWVGKALNSPEEEARKALIFVLAANKANSVAQIQGASDAVIQANVDAVRSALVSAYATERV